jgi:hypothetical protein
MVHGYQHVEATRPVLGRVLSRKHASEGLALAVTGGMVLGLIFGDHIFPQLEIAFGDPLTDIILGLWGAIVAGFLFEMFAFVRNRP